MNGVDPWAPVRAVAGQLRQSLAALGSVAANARPSRARPASGSPADLRKSLREIASAVGSGAGLARRLGFDAAAADIERTAVRMSAVVAAAQGFAGVSQLILLGWRPTVVAVVVTAGALVAMQRALEHVSGQSQTLGDSVRLFGLGIVAAVTNAEAAMLVLDGAVAGDPMRHASRLGVLQAEFLGLRDTIREIQAGATPVPPFRGWGEEFRRFKADLLALGGDIAPAAEAVGAVGRAAVLRAREKLRVDERLAGQEAGGGDGQGEAFGASIERSIEREIERYTRLGLSDTRLSEMMGALDSGDHARMLQILEEIGRPPWVDPEEAPRMRSLIDDVLDQRVLVRSSVAGEVSNAVQESMQASGGRWNSALLDRLRAQFSTVPGGAGYAAGGVVRVAESLAPLLRVKFDLPSAPVSSVPRAAAPGDAGAGKRSAISGIVIVPVDTVTESELERRLGGRRARAAGRVA